MVQLVALGLIGGVAWFGYRSFKKHMETINRDLREREARSNPKNIKPLERGDDGVYRPKGTSENQAKDDEA